MSLQTRARPATPQTARAINDRAALDLFAARGALTAGDLQQATGLARPTVADLLARLAGDGLIEQIGETGADRRGPNARLYALDGRAGCIAGLDVRRSRVGLAVADLAGRLLARRRVEIPPGMPGGVALGMIADRLRDAATVPGAGRLHTVVIGLPGLINPITRQVSGAREDLAWHAELRGAAARSAGLDPAAVIVENEVNLAALAEHRALQQYGEDTFGLLWLADGVGAGLVLDGVLRRGASGGAGEIGYLAVPGGAPDPGDLAGPGGPGRPSGPASLCDLVSSVPLRELAAEHGTTPDDFGHEGYLAEAASRIATGTVALAVTVDPGLIVLGGPTGLAGGEALAGAVARETTRVCPVPTRVRPTAVPGNPILTGAVATALARARTALWPAG
jgi:predicted NBD/HSP70 family sugar kinase